MRLQCATSHWCLHSTANECSKYAVLDSPDRAMGFKDQKTVKCDKNLAPGWYSFRGAAGTKMPTACVEKHSCGAHSPGWLNGSHPTVADGIVGRQVCFHWEKDCCAFTTQVKVRNCGTFFVYKFYDPPSLCSLRYCGDGDGHGKCSILIVKQKGIGSGPSS